MRCEECGRMNGHHPRCPNNPDPAIVAVCDLCEEEIHEGEDYYDSPDGVVCENCADEYYQERFINERRTELVKGDY